MIGLAVWAAVIHVAPLSREYWKPVVGRIAVVI
jgi:hypothetical protein